MLSIEQISACGVVPVIVLDDASHAVPTARALLKGGVNSMEITFRTDAAAESIARVAAEVPEMIVGAGTVISTAQLRDAVSAGARYIVCPGTSAELIREAQRLETPILPAVVTPSEIMVGLELGIEVFKFFPAGNYGGLKTIKALCGPFPQIRFLPTGGISMDNAADYFREKKIQAVGGSWMATREMITQERYDEIEKKCAEVTALFHTIRG